MEEDSNTSIPSPSTSAFFIKESDDEDVEEGGGGIVAGTSGGKRWGQRGYGGGAIFRPAASSLVPSFSSSPVNPPTLLLALPLPTSVLRKMSAL